MTATVAEHEADLAYWRDVAQAEHVVTLAPCGVPWVIDNETGQVAECGDVATALVPRWGTACEHCLTALRVSGEVDKW